MTNANNHRSRGLSLAPKCVAFLALLFCLFYSRILHYSCLHMMLMISALCDCSVAVFSYWELNSNGSTRDLVLLSAYSVHDKECRCMVSC